MSRAQPKVLRMFRSDEAKARYMAIYDVRLRSWPVSYEQIRVPTRFGRTHVIASGPADAPPLVLLPCMMLSNALRLRQLQARGHEWLRNGVRTDPLDANWIDLIALATFEGARMNMVAPSVFRKSELQRILAPTLLLIGDKEVLYEPHSTLRRAMQRMPELQGAIVYGANHNAALTQPEDVNARIVRFLSKSSNAGTRAIIE